MLRVITLIRKGEKGRLDKCGQLFFEIVQSHGKRKRDNEQAATGRKKKQNFNLMTLLIALLALCLLCKLFYLFYYAFFSHPSKDLLSFF